MRLSIRHTTTYRYQTPVSYSIQQLRLTPVSTAGQLVVHWSIESPGKLEASIDAYGNVMHTLVLTRAISTLEFLVGGEVDSSPLPDGRLHEGPGRIPIEHFTCSTRLTRADEAITALAHSVPTLDTPNGLLQLAERIRGDVAYEGGITGVSSSAAQALALGRGVCQDHAHLMLACCRARGLPARYVSGYIHPGDVPHAASHAWSDVWLPHLGWISIDVTHARFASGPYCRVALGRDYAAAAPVRGMRVGGGEEALDVDVQVDSLDTIPGYDQ